MNHKSLFILFILLCANVTFAQQEASFWYFGQNAGLQFNSSNGTVTAITDGQIDTLEGCTSISSATGDLLFYTDGRTVWNQNHQIMTNGDYFGGTGLLGDPSSTSSGLIVPKPQDPTQYYIFTVDEPHHDNANAFPNQFTGNYDSGGSVPGQDDGFNNGFAYSLVDMTLDGGLGNIANTEKNILLTTYDVTNPLEQAYKCSEKITAVKADDCSSFWVITHFVNKFYAFKVDINGVQTTPVISTVGPEVPISGYRRNSLGYLKASPDGSKLAVAHFGFATVQSGNAAGGVYLLDFDNDTGIVSNSVELYSPNSGDSPYGVEFSAENKKVYATIGAGIQGNQASTIFQWNLESSDIPNSLLPIHSSNFFTAGALQLGLDKRIYRAQFNFDVFPNTGRFIGVINNPEASGLAANYDENGILLDINGGFQNTSQIGLPPFIQSLFNSQIDIIQNGNSTTELKLCNGDSYTLKAENITGADYLWMKDGVQLSEISFALNINSPGFYQVFIEPNNGECPIEGEALVSVFDIPTAIDTTLIQCDEDSTPKGFTTFNLNQAFDNITEGADNRQIEFYSSISDLENNNNQLNANNFSNTLNPQTIYALVTNTVTNCTNTATITLEVSTTASNNTGISVCDDDGIEDGFYNFNLGTTTEEILFGLPSDLEVVFYETYDAALKEDSPLQNTFTNTIAYNQIIYARVENRNACYGISEIKLTVLELPNVLIEEELFYCLNTYPKTIILRGGIVDDTPNNYYYDWSTGENTSEIEINKPGVYTVRVTSTDGCFKDRKINVLPSDIATVTNIEVTDATSNNTISVFVSGDGMYEYALDSPEGPYQDSNTFENVSFGFHTVYVRDIKNNCGIIDEIVSVIGFPKFFTPNGDNYNPYWQVKGISKDFQTNSEISIYDRYGKLLAKIDPLGPGWDGTYNGYDMPASDYWFEVTLQDGRIFKNHFTLKR